MISLPPQPPSQSEFPNWARKVSSIVNLLAGQRGFPFPPMDAAPTDPSPGRGYYDTGTNKARIWDGSGWNDLW